MPEHPRRRPVGQLIHSTRKRRRITAVDFAAKCNVSRGIVHWWERQSYILPKNLNAIANALNVPVASLFQANGRRPKKIA
jgi:transcriptional regulator with XRE-family HTH domain